MDLYTNGPPGVAKLTALRVWCHIPMSTAVMTKSKTIAQTVARRYVHMARDSHVVRSVRKVEEASVRVVRRGLSVRSVVVDHYVHVEGLSESAGTAEEKAYVSMDANTTSVRSVMTLLACALSISGINTHVVSAEQG